MTTTDSDHVCDLHHESPQTEVLLPCQTTSTQRTARELWCRMRLILQDIQAHKVLIPIVDKAKNPSLTTTTTTTVDHHQETPEIELVQSQTYSSSQQNAHRFWRRMLFVLQVHAVMNSTDQVNNQSPTITEIITSESPAYTALTVHDADAQNPTTIDQSDSDIHLIDIQNDIEEKERNITFTTNISMESLSSIVKEKNHVALRQLGGIEGIASALNTNLENGLSSTSEDLHLRKVEYGSNIYSATQNPSEGFLHSVFKATKDWTIFLLLCCALLSLGTGIKEEGLRNGWYDGTTIFLAIFILITASSISNYWRVSNLKKLFDKKKQAICALRDGRSEPIPVSEVVVGDVVFLKTGDQVPADGLLLNGQNLKVRNDIEDLRIDRVENPFLFSGAKVIEGSAHMIVTSVGMNTVWGEMMCSVNHDPRVANLLKVRLDKLNSYIQNTGLILATLILVILLLRYLLGKQDDETGYPDLKGKRTAIRELIKAMERLIAKPRGISTTGLTTMVAVLLVGIQEGLSFMITLCLCYWNGRMANDQVVIQELCAAVTMGSVTTICADKSVQLTLDQMEVDMLWVGEKAICRENTSVISKEVLEALCDAVGTPVLECDKSTNSVEDALLHWAKSELRMDMDALKQTRTVINTKSLFAEQKRSGLLMRKHGDAERIIHLHWKGAAEKILPMCCYYYDCNGMIKVMDEQKRAVFEQVIGDRASKGLHTHGFAYKQIVGNDGDTEDVVTNLQEDGLNLLGLMGLKYPYCPEAKKAVASFLHAGVSIKLVCTENLSVLRAIATECGILQPDQDVDAAVLKGEEFRKLSQKEKMEMVDRISIMASSLPSDKLLLVQCLKEKGQVVAVTGAITSDSPALKEADVGILMGTEFSEKAKESSDIIISKGNLDSILAVMLTGRCVYGNIRKFIQLELIMNISGLLITFVTTASLGESPMTAIQLLWVNLTVSTLAAMALLTEAPIPELQKMTPVPQTEPLITKPVWWNIISQVMYQAVVLLIFQFKGQVLPGIDWKLKKAMIFNSFFLCQVFNQINAREPEKKNVFKGIAGNYWFLVAVGVPIILQVVAMQFITNVIDTTKLNCIQWIGCVFIATISWPIDYVVKCLSDFAKNRSMRLLGSGTLLTSPIPSIPLTSQCKLPVVTVEENAYMPV